MIYLDYAANTPIHPDVLDVYQQTTTCFLANPNATHALGTQATERLTQATTIISDLLGVKNNEVIYTSGATEANNLAIKGIASAHKQYGKHMITSYLEHSSILGAMLSLQEEGFEVDFVDINSDGTINIEHFKELLRKDTVLVSLAAIDGEIGTIQDMETLYTTAKQQPHCTFHTDATQAIGKSKVDSKFYDCMTLSPHKFYGLNGFGMLVCKEHIFLHPQIVGGISSTPYRSGTPVLAMVCALEVALTMAMTKQEEHYSSVSSLRQQIRQQLASCKQVVINSSINASPYILNISIKGKKSEAIQGALSDHEIYVSTKAACCAVNTISKPVYAMTRDRKLALSTIRISLSHLTTSEEIKLFIQIFLRILSI